MFGRKRDVGDFQSEIKEHLELETERLQAEGLSESEARAAAHRAFGNVMHAEERFYEAGRWLWWDPLRQDVRYAFRMLRKSPGFTATAVLTMALGIGATTAIFGLVNATLLHPLPYPDSEQLVSVVDDLPGAGAKDVGISQPEWEDLQRSGAFDYVSPTWFDENNLTGGSQPARVRLLLVAPNYFALLGVRAQLGRTFHPEDHSPGILPEVVISDGLWKGAFGGDPKILDKSVRMDTDLYRIVGVMPEGFDVPARMTEERNIEIWAASNFYGMPLPDHPQRNRRFLPTAIARVKPGMTIAQAQSHLDALVAALEKEFPGDYPLQNAWRVRLLPLKERVVGNVRQSLILLLGAVGLVLLIGCVNIANLLLARASSRQREMAVRQALGAGSKRLMWQLLTESLLLSLAGGAAGLIMLFVTKSFLLRIVPKSLPRLNEVSVSWAVLLFALGASLVAGILFGLAPALQARRLDLIYGLKESTRGSSVSRAQTRMRGLLVVAEFALSLVLLFAGGLLLRSFWDLLNVRLGFNPEKTMVVRTRLPAPNDPKVDLYRTPALETPFLREVLRRAKALPGVDEAAIGDTAAIPLDESLRALKQISEGQFFFNVEGHDAKGEQPSVAGRSSVTPEYFHLLEIPLLRGRLFNDQDSDSPAQVAVVNEEFARVYWPGEDALGKRFRRARAEAPWITVVGVLANARTESLAEASVPQIYLDLYQTHENRLAIFLRGRLDEAAIPAQVRAQVQAVDPRLPVIGGQTLKETASASLAERRFLLEVVGLFSLTALLLAGLGVYGLISYMVSERRHEIGIRLALGARSQNIVRMILQQGLRLAIAGAAVGLVGAVVLSRLLAGLLYEVRPSDPLTFACVAILLAIVAVVACLLPARRALRVDPMVALRHE